MYVEASKLLYLVQPKKLLSCYNNLLLLLFGLVWWLIRELHITTICQSKCYPKGLICSQLEFLLIILKLKHKALKRNALIFGITSETHQ